MVSRNRAVEAVRAVAPRRRVAPLLLFLDSLPAEELAQWSIKEADDNELIYDYIFGKAQGGDAGGVAAAIAPEELMLQMLPTPSAMADRSSWSRVQKEPGRRLFKCFRPGAERPEALPVGLYDPVLDQLVAMFSEAMEGHGGGGEPLTEADCTMVLSLCQCMPGSFDNKMGRLAAFNALMQNYVGEPITMYQPNELSAAATAGCIHFRPNKGLSTAMVPVYVQEIKVEMCGSGDPYFQGQRCYQLHLTSPSLAGLVHNTVLPVLFVELVGPYLRVSALASPQGACVVCEPLTPFLHLFDMLPCQPAHMARVARVLRALKHGIRLLGAACADLQQPEHSFTARSAPAAGGTALLPERHPALRLPYPLRPGFGFGDVKPLVASMYNPIYSAKEQGGRAVVVKFTHLSADATRVHKAWAAAGLAPALFDARPLPCGLTMLVMELLAPQDGWTMFHSLPLELKQQLHGVVRERLREAHGIDVGEGARTVHADMRQANVMVRLVRSGSGEVQLQPPPQVRFLDFDWSGLEGRARLPPFSRVRLPGYGPGQGVSQAYDEELWQHEAHHGDW